MNSLFRQAAVRTAAARQLEDARRVNISGIAAMTGISRAEISGLLKPARRPANRIVEPRQKLTNKILTAWHCDPKFTTANRRPADLKIYGRGATFESLVREHGRGIPIRAILDEMMRSGAIEMRGSQEIRPTKSVTIGPRITPQSIQIVCRARCKTLFSYVGKLEASRCVCIYRKRCSHKDISQFHSSIPKRAFRKSRRIVGGTAKRADWNFDENAHQWKRPKRRPIERHNYLSRGSPKNP